MLSKPGKLTSFILLCVVWTLIALIFATISYLGTMGENNMADGGRVFMTGLVRFYLWAAFTPLIFWFSKYFNFVNQKSWLRNLLIHFPAIFLFTTLNSFLYGLFLWMTVPTLAEHYTAFLKFFQVYVFWGSLYTGILICALMIVTINAFLFYRRYSEQKEQASLLEARLAESRLQALKMQLHPHFLFNTLHSISALVLENPVKANEMIARLGNFLRLTLEHSDEQIVTLNQELDFLRSYLEIEQIRFQDRLTVRYELEPEALTSEVPHLILQPIVENAVKHGVAPYSSAVEILVAAKISGKNLRLQIRDNGRHKNGKIGHGENIKNGTGLANVRSRLKQIYGEDFALVIKNDLESGFEIELTIPYALERG